MSGDSSEKLLNEQEKCRNFQPSRLVQSLNNQAYASCRSLKDYEGLPVPVILAVLAAGLLPISTTNAQRYTDIKVRPPLIIETPGRPPHRGVVWIPGHWRWSNRHHYWVWVRGHWAKR